MLLFEVRTPLVGIGGGPRSGPGLTALPLLFPDVMVTWSVPGRNLGSPQERCWPSGPSAPRDAVLPVYSGMLTATGPWPWCETVSAVSSSSHGDF